MHRPGEFSIGPHCDAQYNLPDGNLNVWLPLTDAAHTNSLYVESTPGARDFHPLNLKFGQLATFYGARGRWLDCHHSMGARVQWHRGVQWQRVMQDCDDSATMV